MARAAPCYRASFLSIRFSKIASGNNISPYNGRCCAFLRKKAQHPASAISNRRYFSDFVVSRVARFCAHSHIAEVTRFFPVELNGVLSVDVGASLLLAAG